MKMSPTVNPTISKEPYCFCSYCWTFWTADEEGNGKRENARIWACPECVEDGTNDPTWLARQLGILPASEPKDGEGGAE